MKWLFAVLFAASSAAVPAQKRFSDARYGVSFTYARGYILKTGPLGPHDTGLGYLGPIPMEFSAPDGARIATVEAPSGSYPGTDFVNAFFTLSVNRFITQGECEQFLERQDKSPTFLMKTKRGLILHGVEQPDGGLGHQFFGQYYHAFSRGQCIELGYGIATAGLGTVDGMKPAPYRSIRSRFKTILQSVTLSRPKIRRAHGSPAIQGFAFTPLDSPSGRYTFTWDVTGARGGTIFLSADCKGYITVGSQTPDCAEATLFVCGVLHVVSTP